MDSKDSRRLVTLSLFVLLLFCFIIVQFYQLQIVEGDKWSRLAKQQHHFSISEPFKRGRFLGNHELKENHVAEERVLVCDVKRYHLYVDPLAVPEPYRDEITENLFELLPLTWEEKNNIPKQFLKHSRSRKLKMWLTEAEKGSLEKWWRPYARWKKIPLNALYFAEDYRRFYPYGKLLGSVLHTVRDDRDPETNQCFPTGGLELTLDAHLRGKHGKRLQLRSPRQPLESGVVVTHPEDGADIYLTIEPFIQAIAEEEIEHAVKQAGAKSGWAMMMDPHTGEVVALAQYPGFEPANYRAYYNDPSQVEATKVHALTDCFEPGSTMKPISVAVAFLANKELERRGKETIFSPTEMIPTWNGAFPGRKTPIRDVGNHQHLNMYLAIQKSSNIYVAKLIQRVVATLGDRWYRQQLEEVFGFGRKTGIELPSESEGLLPTPEKKYGSGQPQWSTPTPYSLSFGYNLLTTSVQILRAYAIIANGGWDVRPTLVKKIVKGEELILDHHEELASRKRLLDGDISRELTFALKSVTKPGGGGFRADIPGYTEAGKTGTTEKIVKGMYSKKHHFSSFIGFAPASSPRFVLYIAIDEPEYRYLPGVGKTYFGGRCASPVFSKIMYRTFKYLGIPQDDPHGFPLGDPRFDVGKADWMEQVEILKDLYGKWNQR